MIAIQQRSKALYRNQATHMKRSTRATTPCEVTKFWSSESYAIGLYAIGLKLPAMLFRKNERRWSKTQHKNYYRKDSNNETACIQWTFIERSGVPESNYKRHQ